jgi:hypothetical protein
VLVAAVTNRKRIRVLGIIINQGDTTPSTVTLNTKGAGAGTAIFAAVEGRGERRVRDPVEPGRVCETNAVRACRSRRARVRRRRR